MCTFFLCKAIMPVHENLILIPNVISILLPLMTKTFSDIFSSAV